MSDEDYTSPPPKRSRKMRLVPIVHSVKEEDACPHCLDNLKVVKSESHSVIKRNAVHAWYDFKCPECSHEWVCMFYTKMSI